MKLSELETGGSAAVKEIDKSCKIKHRLAELGFLETVKIRCIRKSLFGTPILYRIMGCNIALRRTDAEKIAVVNR